MSTRKTMGGARNLKMGENRERGQGPRHRGNIFFVFGPNINFTQLLCASKNVQRGPATDT